MVTDFCKGTTKIKVVHVLSFDIHRKVLEKKVGYIPVKLLAVLNPPYLVMVTFEQSHYREVARWEIFMEQELRFGLDLGRFGNF